MTQVIIQDILPRTQATATGGQTVYSTTWTADTESDVVVYSRAAGVDADDATQQLDYPSDFSVAFIGLTRIVQVTLVTPSTVGDIVTIIRDTPADRENIYTNTNFTPSMLNNDFGILTLVDQQAQLVNQGIAPRYNYSAIINPNVSFPDADTILPILGASQIWVKNAADTAIIALDVPDSGFAPQDATYVTLTDETALIPNSFPLDSLTNGILINKSSTNELLVRQITGTSGQITIVNGTGISGDINVAIATNPIMPGTAGMGLPEGTTGQRVIPATGVNLRFNTTIVQLEYWDGTEWQQIAEGGSITTLTAGTGIVLTPNPIIETGTIALAVPVSLANGGTNKALVAANGGIVYSDADSFEILAPTATAGQMLVSGSNAAPSWSTATFPTAAGATGTILRSNGTGWIASTATFADTYGASTLLYSNGANTVAGLATANSAALVTNSTGVPVWSGTLTNGQIIIGSTGATPTAGTITAGPGISISNGPASITISGTGSGIGWTEVTGTTQAMIADSGYVASNVGLVTLTLPTTAAFGTAISIVGKGAGGWIIAQNASQIVQVGSVGSTAGVGGSVASTNRYDSINLICTTANTIWTTLGGVQSAGLTIV